MKLFKTAAVLSILACSPAFGFDLSFAVGKHPDKNTLAQPAMKQVLNKTWSLIGDKAVVQKSITWLNTGVAGTINSINDIYYINACQPHECDTNGIKIAAEQDAYGSKSTQVWVEITVNGKTSYYGGTPDRVKEIMAFNDRA